MFSRKQNDDLVQSGKYNVFARFASLPSLSRQLGTRQQAYDARGSVASGSSGLNLVLTIKELNSERQRAVSQCSHLFDLQNKSELTCVGKNHHIFAVICTVRTLFQTSMQMCLKSNRVLNKYRQGRFTITLL